jgi:hypothetical protein
MGRKLQVKRLFAAGHRVKAVGWAADVAVSLGVASA